MASQREHGDFLVVEAANALELKLHLALLGAKQHAKQHGDGASSFSQNQSGFVPSESFDRLHDAVELTLLRSALQTGTPLGNDKFKAEIEAALNLKVGYARRGRPRKEWTSRYLPTNPGNTQVSRAF